MLDLASVNQSLGALAGAHYQPAAEKEVGAFYADDSLVCFISGYSEYLHLRVPILYPDELENEDIRSETEEDTDFYQEEVTRFDYFLHANRYAGNSRGLCVCLDPELDAISLNCKALLAVLTENGLQQLIYSMFMIVLKQRIDLFPDEVAPALAQLVSGNSVPLSLDELSHLVKGRV